MRWFLRLLRCRGRCFGWYQATVLRDWIHEKIQQFALKFHCNRISVTTRVLKVRPWQLTIPKLASKFQHVQMVWVKGLKVLKDIWVFPKIGVPQNRWFIIENPIKMDDLGGKPTIFGNTYNFLCLSGRDFGLHTFLQHPILPRWPLRKAFECNTDDLDLAVIPGGWCGILPHVFIQLSVEQLKNATRFLCCRNDHLS